MTKYGHKCGQIRQIKCVCVCTGGEIKKMKQRNNTHKEILNQGPGGQS